MATLNYNMCIPHKAQPYSNVPRWTQDGRFESSVPLEKEQLQGYPLVDDTDDWYYLKSDVIEKDGNLVIYIPDEYTLVELKQYSNGWKTTNFGNPGDRNRIEVGSYSDLYGNNYTTYTHYFLDTFDFPIIGIEIYAVKLELSNLPNAKVTETNQESV